MKTTTSLRIQLEAPRTAIRDSESMSPRQYVPPPFALGHRAAANAAWRPVHYCLVAALLVVEIPLSVAMASINPATTWDESAYLTAGRRIAGQTEMPYPHHRPPLLPFLIAMAGKHYRSIPAIAHIAAALLMLLILKELATPSVVVGGTALTILSGDLRFAGMHLLTEIISVSLLLLLILFFITNRPFRVGAVAFCLAVSHWQMCTVLPVVLVDYALCHRWRDCRRAAVGAALAAAPFLIASTMYYGHPLDPILLNLGMNTVEYRTVAGRIVPNDMTFYMRVLHPGQWLLFAAAAAGWIAVYRRDPDQSVTRRLCTLLLAVTCIQLILVHAVSVKGTRLLVPLIPLLLLSVLLLLDRCTPRRPARKHLAWPILAVAVIAVMPGRNLRWEMHDMLTDPVNQVLALRSAIDALDPHTILYTDINDIAVSAHTGRRTVPVTGPNTSHFHYKIDERRPVTRNRIPPDAAYLTWNPAGARILATAPGNPLGALYLVRWAAARAHTPTPPPLPAS